MGWGQKVVGYMPWGALSGSPLVRGHQRVFRGSCGGFRAPTCNSYRYIHIDTHTCIYIHIPTHTCIVPDHNTYSNDIQTRYRQIATDTYKYLQITTPLKIPTIYLHIPTITTHTYIHDTYR